MQSELDQGRQLNISVCYNTAHQLNDLLNIVFPN